MKEQIIPEAAIRDSNSVEILRVWIAERQLQCSIRVGFYEGKGNSETKAWGITLADVVKHLAGAIHLQDGSEKLQTVNTIKDEFIKELNKPTSASSGDFIEKY